MILDSVTSVTYDVIVFVHDNWTTLVCKELGISAGAPTKEKAWEVLQQVYISNERIRGGL